MINFMQVVSKLPVLGHFVLRTGNLLTTYAYY